MDMFIFSKSVRRKGNCDRPRRKKTGEHLRIYKGWCKICIGWCKSSEILKVPYVGECTLPASSSTWDFTECSPERLVARQEN